jgi:hypothetical protein
MSHCLSLNVSMSLCHTARIPSAAVAAGKGLSALPIQSSFSISGFEKRLAGCWTSVIWDSCGVQQWKSQHWIPSLIYIFFTHQVSPPNARSRSQRLSVCRWHHCALLIVFTDKGKARCALWSYSPRDVLVFF